MFGLGLGEILIISAFALIFIGPQKLPALARSVGKSLREFQQAKDELLEQVNAPVSTDSKAPTGVGEAPQEQPPKRSAIDEE